MTPYQFANLMLGKPWVRWRSDFDACDCWGLVVLYYREVRGIDLGAVPNTDLTTGYMAEVKNWIEVDTPSNGATVMTSWRGGNPTHCGIVLDVGDILHCAGNLNMPGNVRIDRIKAIERIYGKVKFYDYHPA